MGEFALHTKTYGNEDQRWLGNGGQPGMPCKSIVLDRSLFDLETDFPDGFIPSGVRLAPVTATGLYGPYDDTAVDGRETLAGHLFTATEYDRTAASTADLHAALFWDGEVVETYLPEGPVDANGKADVAGHIKYVTDVVGAES